MAKRNNYIYLNLYRDTFSHRMKRPKKRIFSLKTKFFDERSRILFLGCKSGVCSKALNRKNKGKKEYLNY